MRNVARRVPSALALAGVLLLVGTAVAAGYSLLARWGSEGSRNGQFQSLSGVAADGRFVYVLDTTSQRVQKFTPSGRFVARWPVSGEAEGIATDRAGHVYVGDPVGAGDSRRGRGQIRKFTTGGRFVRAFAAARDDQPIIEAGKLAADGRGNVYVAGSTVDDELNDRATVSKYNASGRYVTAWPVPCNPLFGGTIFADYGGTVLVADCPGGTRKYNAGGRLLARYGFHVGAVDAYGNMFVSDRYRGGGFRMRKFSSRGRLVATWYPRGFPPRSREADNPQTRSGYMAADSRGLYLLSGLGWSETKPLFVARYAPR